MNKRTLSRTDFNFLLDSLLLVLFVSLMSLSVVVDFVFPPGPQADGWNLWGKSYGDWSTYRFANLAILAVAVLLHVMLHWSWVCGVIASRLGKKKTTSHDDPSRTLWGVGLLIVIMNLIGGFVAAAALSIQMPVAAS